MFIANLKYKKSIKEVNKVLEAHLKYLDKYFEKTLEIITLRKHDMGNII